MCGQVRAKKKKGFEYAKLNCWDMGYLNSVGKGDWEIKGCDKREIISSWLCRGDGWSYMQGRHPTHTHFFDFKMGNTQSKPGPLPWLPTTLAKSSLVLFAAGMQDFQGPLRLLLCDFLFIFRSYFYFFVAIFLYFFTVFFLWWSIPAFAWSPSLCSLFGCNHWS